MAMIDSPVKLTYEDYLHFPEDGRRHELIGGDHHVTPAPGTKHQIIVTNFLRLLAPFVHQRASGRILTAPVDVVLSEVDVVQPDLVFVRAERLDLVTEAHLGGAPDLAVEIVSESSRQRDEVTKRHLYERYGVGEYWIVDPVVETVKVFRLGKDRRFRRESELSQEEDDALKSPLFPGLAIPLAELFG